MAIAPDGQRQWSFQQFHSGFACVFEGCPAVLSTNRRDQFPSLDFEFVTVLVDHLNIELRSILFSLMIGI